MCTAWPKSLGLPAQIEPSSPKSPIGSQMNPVTHALSVSAPACSQASRRPRLSSVRSPPSHSPILGAPPSPRPRPSVNCAMYTVRTMQTILPWQFNDGAQPGSPVNRLSDDGDVVPQSYHSRADSTPRQTSPSGLPAEVAALPCPLIDPALMLFSSDLLPITNTTQLRSQLRRPACPQPLLPTADLPHCWVQMAAADEAAGNPAWSPEKRPNGSESPAVPARPGLMTVSADCTEVQVRALFEHTRKQ